MSLDAGKENVHMYISHFSGHVLIFWSSMVVSTVASQKKVVVTISSEAHSSWREMK